MTKMKEIVKSIVKEIYDFVADNPVITVFLAYTTYLVGCVGFYMAKLKKAMKTPEYWKKEIESCDEMVDFYKDLRKDAVNKLAELSK